MTLTFYVSKCSDAHGIAEQYIKVSGSFSEFIATGIIGIHQTYNRGVLSQILLILKDNVSLYKWSIVL